MFFSEKNQLIQEKITIQLAAMDRANHHHWQSS